MEKDEAESWTWICRADRRSPHLLDKACSSLGNIWREGVVLDSISEETGIIVVQSPDYGLQLGTVPFNVTRQRG